MGYRSEVYLGIDSEIVEQLLTFVGINQNVYTLLFEHSEYAKKTKKGGIHFHWEFIKWYPQYQQVAQLTEFLQEHEEQMKFLRIGESYDDVEEEGGSEQFYFEVNRTVECHFE